MESANKNVYHHEDQEESSNPTPLTELEFEILLQQQTVQQQTVQQQTVQRETVQQERFQQEIVQQQIVQRETVQQERFQQEIVQQQTVQQQTVQQLVFCEEFGWDLEQFASEPSISDLAPIPKRSKLSDYQPLTSQSMTDFSCVSPTTSNNNTMSRKRNLDDTEEEFPLPPHSFKQFLDFLEEFVQDIGQGASEPSTNNLAPSLKKSKLSDDQPSTSQSVADFSCVPPTTTNNNTVSRKRNLDDMKEEFPPFDLLEEFGWDLEQAASEPSTSNLAPSPKKSKLSNDQPSTSQSMADFSCVPPTTTNSTVSRKSNLDDTEEEFPLPSPSFRALLDFLEEFGQDLEEAPSEPSTSNLAPHPKKSKLSNYQPSTSLKQEETSKEFETVDGEELTNFIKQFKQEMGDVDAEAFESTMRPSSKRTKVSDYHPSTRRGTAGPPYVPSTATRERYFVETKAYIKKPPNAFMLFRAEQRQKVVYELGIADCARVNKELGRRWKMLSEEEQEPYFEQALRERRAHKAMFPEWSARDNFGKKVRHRNIAVPNYHHIGFPANQQPWPYATSPMSFPPQAPYHQGPYYPTWGPSQQSSYQPGGPSWGPYYQPGGPSQGL